MPTQYDHRKVEWPPPLPPLVMTRLEGLKVHAVEVTDPQRHSVHIHGAPAHVPAGRLVRAANGDVHRVCRLCRGWGALGDCRYVREQSRMGHPYTRTRKVRLLSALLLPQPPPLYPLLLASLQPQPPLPLHRGALPKPP